MQARLLTFEFGWYGTFEGFVQPQADRTAPRHVDVDPVQQIGRFRLVPAQYHPAEALDAAFPQADLFVDFTPRAARHRRTTTSWGEEKKRWTKWMFAR